MDKPGDRPLHHSTKGFINPEPEENHPGPASWTRFFIGRLRYAATRQFMTPRPALKNDGRLIHHNPPLDAITWIGHASFLIRMEGVSFLTDPVWSLRASPFSWAGPKRCVEPGLELGSLPPIDFVLVSHDHYDHFDAGTIMYLAGKGATFFTPPGFRKYFDRMNIKRFLELDWEESAGFGKITVTSTPARHFSGRGLFDRNRSLWAGWVVSGKKKRLFFMGDSGYFRGFKETGRKYGPFDMAILPISAYLPAEIMHDIHMTPEEAIQASADLQSRICVASHWGTFSLSDEPMDEPPARARKAAEKSLPSPSALWLMRHGETRRW